jgi:hypothetical protein
VGKPGTKGLGTPFAREQKPLRAGQGRRLLAADLRRRHTVLVTTTPGEGGTYVDSRDDESYDTMRSGGQEWLAQNLR